MQKRVAFLALLSGSVVACTSLLGDFTSGGGEPGSQEGGTLEGGGGDDGSKTTDSSIPPGEGGMGGDTGVAETSIVDSSGGDGAIPLVPLQCQTWRLAQPLLVKSLDSIGAGGSAGDFNGVTPFPVGTTKTRVAAGRFTTNAFSVYEIDSSQTPPTVTSVDAPISGTTSTTESVATVTRLIGGFGVVVSYTDAQGLIDLDLYPFRDADPISPLPTPVRLMQLESVNSGPPAAVLEVAPSTYFVAISPFSTTNSVSLLEVGLATGGAPANPVTVDTSTQNNFGSLVLSHSGSSVFIDVIGTSGPAFYQVADTATTGGPRVAVSRQAGAGILITGEFTDAVPGSAANTTNLAYMELDANDAGTAFGQYLLAAAPVANSKLPTLAISDIGFGKSYTDLASVPGPTNPGRFFGDDYVAISPGLDQQSDPTTWVNFLWLDVRGVVRGEQSGINGVLPGLGNLINQNNASIAASPGARTAKQAAWNVVWAQQERDDAGLFYNSLFYNELDCTP